MLAATPETRPLTPGSAGWTCADLDQPEIDRQWHDQRVELVHGVIADMPSPMFAHGVPVHIIMHRLATYFEEREVYHRLGSEVDLQLSATTRFRADAILLLEEDLLRQERQAKLHRPHQHPMGVIIVPPTLVIESISPGHETTDRIEKFRDYASFGVPHYWIVDAYEKRFDGWRLSDGLYVPDFALQGEGTARPASFPGLELPMGKVFP